MDASPESKSDSLDSIWPLGAADPQIDSMGRKPALASMWRGAPLVSLTGGLIVVIRPHEPTRRGATGEAAKYDREPTRRGGIERCSPIE